jgi:hypothetical protein
VARTFGERLFSTIFAGQVYAAYVNSRTQAGEDGLRIKLGLDSAESLEDLPWELLRDPTGDYLALSRQTPILRYPRLLNTRPLVEVSLPLRVLVLISSPHDQEPLDVEGEWRALQEATADLRSRGLLELERVDDAQLTTLQRKLRAGVSYQVFHFIGHAAFDERSQTGMLAFEDPQSGNTVAVSGEALARELSEENSIRLVVLNACQGARKNRKDPFAGIASSIVARGLPAVVAMQFAITDAASRTFAQEFYRAISEGYPIEAALAESRRALSSTLNTLEWVTPVLYLRAPTGVLFPKRRSYSARPSTGGLREALFRLPALLSLGLIGMVAIILVLAYNSGKLPATLTPSGSGTPSMQIATLTPTVNTAPRDVDLAVTGLRILPPSPAPGQQVTIALKIFNKGYSDSGPFSWAWFADNVQENPIPTLKGDVANLSAGLTTTIIINYRFPWWGTYASTAWVNPDNKVPEKNPVNNFMLRNVITSNDPFVIDFSRLPDGSLLEPRDLAGNEFAAWGFLLSATGDAECSGAVVKLGFSENGASQISTGKPGQENACADLPISFTLNAPPASTFQVDRMAVTFLALAPGAYTLELHNAAGEMLTSQKLDVTSSEVSSINTLTVGGNGKTLNQAIITLRVPANAPDIIQGISFMLPQ